MPLSASEARLVVLAELRLRSTLHRRSGPTDLVTVVDDVQEQLQPTWLRWHVALLRALTSLAEAAMPKEGRGYKIHWRSHRLRVNRCGLEELENLCVLAAQGGRQASSTRTR